MSGGDDYVKVAVTDIDGVLRGKYLDATKFLGATESGFGFCNVVFGWDSSDQCYDNTTYTGWQSGYPDAEVRRRVAELVAGLVELGLQVDHHLGAGVTGELVLRTQRPWAMNHGYYKNPDATAAAWRNGWFHTGDGFRYDEDGYFYIVGRMKDMFISGGENVYPREIEEYLYTAMEDYKIDLVIDKTDQGVLVGSSRPIAARRSRRPRRTRWTRRTGRSRRRLDVPGGCSVEFVQTIPERVHRG